MRTLSPVLVAVGLFLAGPAVASCPDDDPSCDPSCTTDFECGFGRICDMNECVPDDTCMVDSDCYVGETCVEGACAVAAPPTPEELVAEACPCDDEWSNHGQYVRCVVTEVEDLEPRLAADLVAAAARDTCGK